MERVARDANVVGRWTGAQCKGEAGASAFNSPMAWMKRSVNIHICKIERIHSPTSFGLFYTDSL